MNSMTAKFNSVLHGNVFYMNAIVSMHLRKIDMPSQTSSSLI